jgi:hypothetical protein
VVLEALSTVELVLVDDAGAIAGDVGGADVVEALESLGGPAEREDVAGSLDVDAVGDAGGNGEVVDRGEMVDHVHLGREARVAVLAEGEARVGDVAGEHLDPRPAVDREGSVAGGGEHPRLGEGDDPVVGLALEQRRDQAAADEAGEAGDEMGSHALGPYALGRVHPRERETASCQRETSVSR